MNVSYPPKIVAEVLRPAHEFLSDQEYKIWGCISAAGVEKDVSIVDLYEALYANDDRTLKLSVSEMQNYIGAVVSRLNRKLLCHRPLRVGQFTMSECIVPGELKRTYRLVIK